VGEVVAVMERLTRKIRRNFLIKAYDVLAQTDAAK
jgi:hypothetical protein